MTRFQPLVLWTVCLLPNRVFIVTGSHDVDAFSRMTGAILWQADARDGSGVAYDGIAACDGRAIVPTGAGRIRALSATTGATLWTSGNGAIVTIKAPAQ